MEEHKCNAHDLITIDMEVEQNKYIKTMEVKVKDLP